MAGQVSSTPDILLVCDIFRGEGEAAPTYFGEKTFIINTRLTQLSRVFVDGTVIHLPFYSALWQSTRPSG